MRTIITALLCLLSAGTFAQDSTARKLNTQAIRQMSNDSLEAAYQLLNRAIKADAKYYDAYNNRMNIEMRTGRNDEAITTAKKMEAMKPGDIMVNMNLGIMLDKKGDAKQSQQYYTAAINAIDKQLKLKPDTKTKAALIIQKALVTRLMNDKAAFQSLLASLKKQSDIDPQTINVVTSIQDVPPADLQKSILPYLK